jgi:hypothetical protein
MIQRLRGLWYSMKLSLRLWIHSTIEKFWTTMAWRTPHALAYWTACRVMVAERGGTAPYPGNPGDRTCADALQAWG